MKKKNSRIEQENRKAGKKAHRWLGVIWLAFGVELAKRIAGAIVDCFR